MEHHASSLLALDLRRIYACEESADVILVVSGGDGGPCCRLPAHRVVLGSRSPFFARRFAAEPGGSEAEPAPSGAAQQAAIALPAGVRVEAARCLLWYLYSGVLKPAPLADYRVARGVQTLARAWEVAPVERYLAKRFGRAAGDDDSAAAAAAAAAAATATTAAVASAGFELSRCMGADMVLRCRVGGAGCGSAAATELLLPCSRALLCARSTFFGAMLERGRWAEGGAAVVDIGAVGTAADAVLNSADLEALLHFIYTGQLPAWQPVATAGARSDGGEGGEGDDDDHGDGDGGARQQGTAVSPHREDGAVHPLLRAAGPLAFTADYFGVGALRDALDLEPSLLALARDDGEVCAAWRFAREHGLEELAAACVRSIELRFGTVSHARGFARGPGELCIDEEAMAELLGPGRVCAPTAFVVERLRCWARARLAREAAAAGGAGGWHPPLAAADDGDCEDSEVCDEAVKRMVARLLPPQTLLCAAWRSYVLGDRSVGTLSEAL
jgi:hypothetical protein